MKSLEREPRMKWHGMLLCFFNFALVTFGPLLVDVLKNICIVPVLHGSHAICHRLDNYYLSRNQIIFLTKNKKIKINEYMQF